jgi:cytidine deaminase
MDQQWQKMLAAAKKVQDFRIIGKHMEVGGVAAAVLAESGKIYTGVCVDTACGLGLCAQKECLNEYAYAR